MSSFSFFDVVGYEASKKFIDSLIYSLFTNEATRYDRLSAEFCIRFPELMIQNPEIIILDRR